MKGLSEKAAFFLRWFSANALADWCRFFESVTTTVDFQNHD